ncbi:hypothetical protein [Streptomyces tropicalis]|uniref:Uncharacterized protein n=1 Tax=Streptomyces tropicalis TaxID=3034234 RepID=A0ABT6A2K7_9ACTN|nr:hypothetical protein [Streptomyces tropicalis]MDF3298886.1 hypothetical protein [Streptomyces tropicalis]
MSYELEARALLNERLREAERERIVRAFQLKSRAERAQRRARRALASLAA